jgi:hypothetical protein
MDYGLLWIVFMDYNNYYYCYYYENYYYENYYQNSILKTLTSGRRSALGPPFSRFITGPSQPI